MEFLKTAIGHKFLKRDIPEIIKSLNKIEKELERLNDLKEKELQLNMNKEENNEIEKQI